MSDETTLLPCPFCGGEAEVIEADYGMYLTGYAIYCRKCCLKLGVTGRLGEAYEWSPVFNTEAEAIAAWNTRGERTCELKGKSDTCTECGASVERVTHSVYEMGDCFACHPNYCPNCGCKVVNA